MNGRGREGAIKATESYVRFTCEAESSSASQ